MTLSPEASRADLVEEGEHPVLDLDDVHLEDDGRVGRHGALDALLAVAEVRRNRHAPDLALAGALDALVPAGDAGLAHRQHQRLVALVRVVELLACGSK